MKKIKTFSVITCLISFIISCNNNDIIKKEISWKLNEIDSLAPLDDIHLCTELMPDSEYLDDRSKIETLLFERTDGQVDSITKYNGLQNEKSDAVILVNNIWSYKTLKVKFLDGNPLVINRVINSAKQWEKYCGIQFLFGDHTISDITISFLHKGSWSYIGEYCKKMSPSMNLGWLNMNTPQGEIDRVVLHEFGHALGLIHEHLSPNLNIKWNKDLVYAYYKRPPNNWKMSDVDRNIFNKYAFSQVNASSFDKLSIMLYEIPKELTLDGYFTKPNSKISALDSEYISKTYPK